MRAWRTFTLTLACALATTHVAAKPPSPATTASSSEATKATANTSNRDEPLLAFQADLVNVLAPSADAQPLLAAALLARPLPDREQFNDFHALITRATQASDAGPAENWARLVDCDATAQACLNTDALKQLQTQAPDNAAVWLTKLSQDVKNSNVKDAREDLTRAASAKLYDDYSGVALKALANGVSTLPPPKAAFIPNSVTGASGVQFLIVFASAQGMPQPALRDTANFCEQHAPNDASVKEDCLKLGKLLEWGSTPLARALGLHLRQTLSADTSQQQDAQSSRRNLTWQVQNFAQLSLRAQNDKAQSQHLLALARNGGTQMSLVLAALRDAGIATDAPANWQTP